MELLLIGYICVALITAIQAYVKQVNIKNKKLFILVNENTKRYAQSGFTLKEIEEYVLNDVKEENKKFFSPFGMAVSACIVGLLCPITLPLMLLTK